MDHQTPGSDLLRQALTQTCAVLADEAEQVPIEHWNESVFRFFLVREIKRINREVGCWSEWNRVDLVLPNAAGATLVEVKFFTHAFLPHIAGGVTRRKGFPSKKNFAEFNKAIDVLRSGSLQRWNADCGGIADAFVVLAYLDPTPVGPSRYGAHYSSLQPDDRIASVESIVDGRPLGSTGLELTCKLIGVRMRTESESDENGQ